MKILVVGSNGMLGTDLMSELAKTSNSSVGWDINNIDITKKEDTDKITKEKPDILINCAAYTNVDKAESEKELCYKINVKGVENLTRVCKNNNILLIHISTDYVFDGTQKSYDEKDKINPLNYYGKTKADGESLIRNKLEKYYIIRTSWLFGKNGKNFVETISKLCNEKKEIKVVNDQFGRPTYTKDLCKGIINLIINQDKYDYGIYHITNSDSCSWYEFACEIAKLKKYKCKILPCTTEEYPTPAKRPKYSILNNNKTDKLKNWKEALKSYVIGD